MMFVNFRTPATMTATGLSVLWVLGSLFFGTTWEDRGRLLIRGVVFMLGLLLPHLMLVYFKITGKFRWSHLIITGMIGAMLIDIFSALWIVGVAGVITAVIKTVVRIRNFPLFNPAAAGLVVTYYLLGAFPSWWGVSFAPRFTDLGISVAVLITLPLGIYVVKKYRKMPMVMAFLVGFVPLAAFVQGAAVLSLLLEGTMLFLVLIMVTEPKTSPVIVRQQWVYGFVIGLLLASTQTWGFLPLPYTMSLLIGNLVFGLWHHRVLMRTIFKSSPATS